MIGRLRRRSRRALNEARHVAGLGVLSLRRGWWRAGIFLIVASPVVGIVRVFGRSPALDEHRSPFVYVLQ